MTKPFQALEEFPLEETETLAATRDALLPKLLSGEVRVKEAESVMGEAV